MSELAGPDAYESLEEAQTHYMYFIAKELMWIREEMQYTSSQV